MPRFIIEQIAIYPSNPDAAAELLAAIGAMEWHLDTVRAKGTVRGEPFQENVANLSFNYQLGREDGKPLEFEILHYVEGYNWMASNPYSVSHLGMHCSEDDLAEWRAFFAKRGHQVAQEVFTTSHTNPVIAGKRQYNYVIFNTRQTLGVDLKFIVRHEIGRVD